MNWILELLVSVVVALSGAPADGPAEVCASEDANGCVWVADEQGNGAGRSFVATPDGVVVYLPEVVADLAVSR